jgi:hypothetical protein
MNDNDNPARSHFSLVMRPFRQWAADHAGDFR